MWRRLVLVLLPILGLAAGGGLAAESARENDAVRSDLRVERALLELDLSTHDQLRRREKAYRNQILEVEKQIDAMLTQEPVPLDELEILDDTLSSARRAAHGIALRGDALRHTIYGRWRRIALLDIELENRGQATDSTRDPISGTWTLQLLPSGHSGKVDLQLEGTLVGGSYELTDRSWGSFRGTFVGKTLRLERVDSKHGFDLVLEGTIADDRQRVDGTWVATLLTTGGPGSGHWSLQRREEPTEEGEE